MNVSVGSRRALPVVGREARDRSSSGSDGWASGLEEYLEGTTDCLMILDLEWRLTFLNRKAEQEIAKGRDILGATLWETFPGCLGTVFERQYRQCMARRVQASFEAFYDPLGAWYEVHVTPLQAGGLGIWFRNINQRKQVEEGLRLAEERYRLAVRATNDLICDWDLEANRIDWSGGAGTLCGYPDHELGTGPCWWVDRIHPGDQDRVLRQLRHMIASGSDRFASDYRFRTRDGGYAEILDRRFLIRAEDGRPLRMVGALQDQSARNEATARLRERESQLATIFSQAMVGILHSTLEGEVLMVNARLCEILGMSEDRLRRVRVMDLTHPDDLEWNRPLFERSAASGTPFQIEKRYIRGDGCEIWCAVHVSFVRDAEGSVRSCITVVEDISARREAEREAERQGSILRSLVDAARDIIFVKDADGKFVLTNRALDDACGPLVGRRASDHFEPELSERYDAVDREVMRGGCHREVEEMMPIGSEPRLFQTVKVPWVRDGVVAGVVGIARDITERKRIETALRESEELHRSILEASADCIEILDLDGGLQRINGPGVRALRLETRDGLLGSAWPELWQGSASRLARSAVARAAAGSVARFSGCRPTQAGEPRWWDTVVTPMRDEPGRVVRLLCISRDITSVRETADQLRRASEEDALTGLPNRRTFEAELEVATRRAADTGAPVGLLMIDLDHFKHINDTLGHAAGDQMLRSFANRLRRSVRSADFVARLGGDEFAVIAEAIGKEEDLLRLGNAVVRKAKQPLRFEGRMISGGASIGGAIFPRDAGSASELLRNADTALYALKRAGRGGTKLFQCDMLEQAQRAASQLNLARRALTARSVIPHYQPKVRLADGRTDGFEALLRWKHPRRGMQRPGTVAEAFRDYDLASHIGRLMQARVLTDIRRWQAAGVDFGTIAINAAPAEFLRDDYAERLLSLLHQHGVAPAAVQVEVTEHVFLERGSEFVARALKELNKAGVRIALDDFGTGSSSLSHLRDFPVDVVKVDRSFTKRLGDNEELAAIVVAVISLCRSLGIEVVAEGVENEQQRQMLAAMGCTWGQGFLFGRAVAADEISLLLPRALAAA